LKNPKGGVVREDAVKEARKKAEGRKEEQLGVRMPFFDSEKAGKRTINKATGVGSQAVRVSKGGTNSIRRRSGERGERFLVRTSKPVLHPATKLNIEHRRRELAAGRRKEKKKEFGRLDRKRGVHKKGGSTLKPGIVPTMKPSFRERPIE